MTSADSPLYNELNRAWKTTCRIVLGDEVGELKDFSGWLKEIVPEFGRMKSRVSGKDVIFAKKNYCADARFVSLDEIDFRQKFEPLGINQIKDIDSIAAAVAERWEYAGNKALGNSHFVEESDNVMDSQYVAESANVHRSSHVYSAYYVNEGSRYVFGGNWVAAGEFIIKGSGANPKRCFENHWSGNCSDAYFSFFNMDCSEIMFCFGQKNKRHCIGNLQLDKERYAGLKRKLIDEVREELERSKTFPSIYDMVPNEKPKTSIKATYLNAEGDIRPMKKAFSATFKAIFKKEPGDLTGYEGWLSRHLLKAPELTSPFGSKVYRSDAVDEFWRFPEKRIVSQEESTELAMLHMDEKQVTTFEGIKEGLSLIGHFIGTVSQQVTNVIECPFGYHSVNAYKVNDAEFSENCAIGGTLLYSKYVFGSNRLVGSAFCIDCYNSSTLNRCFELDACTKCADSQFCHNCEGTTESMFCFNVKGKRYAIGNCPLPHERYMKTRDALVGQMADEIIKNKGLKWDIFNIGCAK